jgi:putative wzy
MFFNQVGFFFTGALFCYYFQFPLKGVSSYIIPSLAVYLILSFVIIIKNIDITDLSLISIYYIYLSIILGVSAFKFIELGRILRFFIILAVLPLFCFVNSYDVKNKLFKVFIFVSALKALSQVIVYILILYVGDFKPFRYFAQSNHMGDIYPYLNIFIKIQVLGTPLLLFAVMAYLELKKNAIGYFFIVNRCSIVWKLCLYFRLVMFFYVQSV